MYHYLIRGVYLADGEVNPKIHVKTIKWENIYNNIISVIDQTQMNLIFLIFSLSIL